MSEVRILLCVALLIAVSLSGITSSLIGVKMQGMVNQRLPQGEQIESPWWFAKQIQLRHHYRIFFPESNLPTIQSFAGAAILACLVTLALVIGIV
jgi:hypothetical protein